MKKVHVPLAKCSECQRQKPAYGFTTLSTESGTSSRELCSSCFNKIVMGSGGPPVETPELPPLSIADSFGKEHVFYFDVRWTAGLGIRAFELIDGHPGGYEFSIMDHPFANALDVHAELVEKIKSGLSVHYLESSDFGPGHERLYIKGSAINGRIEERNSAPTVVVDGREYSWEQFGSFLSSYAGFNFRLECIDPYDHVEVDPNPQRPDPIWWLERGEAEKAESEPRRFQ